MGRKMKMNKTRFIKKLSDKLGYDEEKCTMINSIIEEHFIIGKNNKEKILVDLIEKLGISEAEANQIYNTVAEVFAVNIKNKFN